MADRGRRRGWTGETCSPDEARERLTCTLTCAIPWVTQDGEHRHRSSVAQPVLPVPDLVLGPA